MICQATEFTDTHSHAGNMVMRVAY